MTSDEGVAGVRWEVREGGRGKVIDLRRGLQEVELERKEVEERREGGREGGREKKGEEGREGGREKERKNRE